MESTGRVSQSMNIYRCPSWRRVMWSRIDSINIKTTLSRSSTARDITILQRSKSSNSFIRGRFRGSTTTSVFSWIVTALSVHVLAKQGLDAASGLGNKSESWWVRDITFVVHELTTSKRMPPRPRTVQLLVGCSMAASRPHDRLEINRIGRGFQEI